MPTSSPEQMLADKVSALQRLLAGWTEMPPRSVGRVACGLGRVVSLWVQCKQATRRGRRQTEADSRRLFADLRAQREDILNLLDVMGCPNGSDILRELQDHERLKRELREKRVLKPDASCQQWMPAHADVRNANPAKIDRALANIAAWLPPPTKADSSDGADWITAEDAVEQGLVGAKGTLTKLAAHNPRLRRDATEDDRQQRARKRLSYLYNVNELVKHARKALA